MSRVSLAVALLVVALAGCDRVAPGEGKGAPQVPGQPGSRNQDANNDGRVTLEEARAGQRRMLERFDADRDGKLSFSEIEAMPERMAGRIDRLDANGDREVTAAEMDAAAEARLRRRDKDGDGVLTGEEMRAGRQREPGSRESTPL